MEESLETRKFDRDIGRELGQKLLSLFPKQANNCKNLQEEYQEDDETTPLINPDEEVTIFSPLAKQAPQRHPKPPALREAFTKQSSWNIVVYTFLALQSVAYDQMLPVYMSFPRIMQRPAHDHALKFFGGFGLSSSEIGSIFSTFGFISMINQFFIFPPVTRRFGSLNCLRVSLGIFPLVYFLSPFATILQEEYRKPFLYTLIIVRNIGGIFSFPCITILLTNSAPSLRVLGTLNGIATALAALGRAIGPTVGVFIAFLLHKSSTDHPYTNVSLVEQHSVMARKLST